MLFKERLTEVETSDNEKYTCPLTTDITVSFHFPYFHSFGYLRIFPELSRVFFQYSLCVDQL